METALNPVDLEDGEPRLEPEPDEDIVEADAAEELAAKEAISRARRRGKSAIRNRLVEERDQALVDFLNQLGHGTDTMKIFVDRKAPKQFQDEAGRVHNLEGRLDTFLEPISEEDLKERYGGGKYAISVQTKNERGKWVFIEGGFRTVTIAGEPNVAGLIAKAPQAARSEDAGVAKTAIDAMQKMVDRSMSQGQGGDPMALAMVQSMQAEMGEMRRAMGEKDDRLLAALTQRPDTSHTERLLEMSMAGESGRIQALRTQHDAELRIVRERAQFDADRQFGMLREQLTDQKALHERELSAVNRAHDNHVAQLGLTHTSTVEGYKREVKRLESDLVKADAEIVSLRAQKILSPLDMVEQVQRYKEAFGGDEGEEPSVLSKLAEAAVPIAQGIAQRLAEGPGGASPAAQAQAADPYPVGQKVKLPDGRVAMRQPDGNVVEIRHKKKPTVEAKNGEMLVLDPGQLKEFIRYVESAVGKVEPAVFAASARHLVPQDIMKALAAGQGVDHFLDEVAKTDPSSPCSTVAGRTWLRAVADAVFV